MTSRNEHSEARGERDRARSPDSPKSPAKPPGTSTQRKWDDVDEASWESFPASDAPASWAGRDRVLSGEAQEDAEHEQGGSTSEDKEPARQTGDDARKK